MLRLLGSREQSFVVTASVEDSDYCHCLVEDGGCDDYALAIADCSQTRAEVIARCSPKRKISEALAERDDRLGETGGVHSSMFTPTDTVARVARVLASVGKPPGVLINVR